MRTWITIITVGIALSAIVFTERMYISDFGEKIKVCVDNIEEKIVEKTVTENDIVELEKEWNNSKDLIYIFANHNSFITLENSVSLMKNYAKNKNYEKLCTELLKFRNCAKDFDESKKFCISNIL